jgi:hypothetical protein
VYTIKSIVQTPRDAEPLPPIGNLKLVQILYMEIASSVMVAGTFEDYRILFENCMDMTIGFRRKSVTLCLTFLTSP